MVLATGLLAMIHGGHGPPSWWWAMPLSMLAFWGLVIAAIVWAAHRFGPRQRSDDALESARRRYAEGELTREQFQRIRGDLHAAAKGRR